MEKIMAFFFVFFARESTKRKNEGIDGKNNIATRIWCTEKNMIFQG
jgi:hypothetical protein